MGEKVREGARAALARVGHVVLPGVCEVVLRHRPELQGDRLREAVVNVVERVLVDVVLALPALAVRVEGNLAVEAHPRHVDAQQPFPGGVALGGRHLGVLVDLVLEVVDHRAVRDEGDGAGQVRVAVLARVVAKELLGPRPRHELHGHRVDLAGLHRGHGEAERHHVGVHVVGERVARLVRDHLDVALRAVEVGKDEGHVVVRDLRHEAAAGLALGGEHVHEVAVEHHVEELAGLGTQRAVEGASGLEDVVGASARGGVAGAEGERLVGKGERVLHAQALGLRAIDLVGQRHHVGAHGLAEALHVLAPVGEPAHAIVAERQVVLIAELPAHGVAHVGELVVDAVEVGLVLLVPGTLRLPRCQALGVVRGLLERRELRERVGAALKGDLRGGDELHVLLREGVLALHVLNDGRVDGTALLLGLGKEQRAVLLLQLGAEGRGEKGRGEGVRRLLQLGLGLVPEGGLGVVELVARVDDVADHRELGGRLRVAVELVLLEKRRLCGLEGRGVGERGGEAGVLRLHGLEVGALVGHVLELHGLVH